MDKPGFWFYVRVWIGLPVMLVEYILMKFFKWECKTQTLYNRWVSWDWN